MASICSPCAEKRGGKSSNRAVGMWLGDCHFCGEPGSMCCDTRDWRLDEDGRPRVPLTREQLWAALADLEADEAAPVATEKGNDNV